MKKILYSRGFGAGWSTWIASSAEEKRFCCEYQPFIEYLEKHKEMPSDTTSFEEQFTKDWKERFPNADDPYLGGIDGLTIYEIDDDDLYRIKEYDGAESVETMESSKDQWL